MIKDSDDKIGIREFFVLIVYCIGVQSADSTPVLLVKDGENAIWMIPLFSLLTIIIPLLVLLSILKKYKDRNLIEIVYDLTGKFVGKLISIIIFLIIFSALILNTRDYIDVISALFFPRTPLVVLYLFFMLIVYFIASKGLENISRICWMTFYPLFFVLVMLLILVWNRLDFLYLFPIAGPGLLKIAKSGVTHCTILADIFVLAIFFPRVRDYKSFRNATFLGLAMSLFYLVIFFIIYVAAFGSDTLRLLNYPYHQLTRIAHLGRFATNLEAFFLFFWIVASILRFSIYLYMTCNIFGNAFKLAKFEFLLLPTSILTVFLGSFFENYVEATETRGSPLIQIFWISIVLLPFLLSIIFKLKKKRRYLK